MLGILAPAAADGDTNGKDRKFLKNLAGDKWITKKA